MCTFRKINNKWYVYNNASSRLDKTIFGGISNSTQLSINYPKEWHHKRFKLHIEEVKE